MPHDAEISFTGNRFVNAALEKNPKLRSPGGPQ